MKRKSPTSRDNIFIDSLPFHGENVEIHIILIVLFIHHLTAYLEYQTVHFYIFLNNVLPNMLCNYSFLLSPQAITYHHMMIIVIFQELFFTWSNNSIMVWKTCRCQQPHWYHYCRDIGAIWYSPVHI